MLPLLLLLVWPAHSAPSTACAVCHREIYERYRNTPMALTSGIPAREDLTRASFTHTASGYQYRIFRTAEGLSFEFAKPAAAVRGTRELPFFLGSGATARSYLLSDDGYYFESPVAYYTAARKWD